MMNFIAIVSISIAISGILVSAQDDAEGDGDDTGDDKNLLIWSRNIGHVWLSINENIGA